MGLIRVFRWDGKEMFISLNAIAVVERDANDEKTDVTLTCGKRLSLSNPSYDVLSGWIKQEVK